MAKLFVENKAIVTPGELIAEGMEYIPAGKTFREKEKIYSSVVGILYIKGRVLKVVPLSGKYMPKKGDVIIGRIINIGFAGWQLDINSPYLADLNIGEAVSEYVDLAKTDLSKFFDIGDWVLAEVISISEGKFVKLTAKHKPYRKLVGGNIIYVSPTKVPRIIGRQGSMIKILKDLTQCDILVGQNGVIWIRGAPERMLLVERAIRKIEREAHISGLTERINQFLRKELEVKK